MKISRLAYAGALLWATFASSSADAQIMEPDKKVYSVGKWTISTARFGVGCVAELVYGDDYKLSIGGEKPNRLTLLITVASKLFSTKLDGSEEELPSIEIALTNNRWGNVQPYGYRGEPGVVLSIDGAFIDSFVISKRMKVTEQGNERLAIDLDNPRRAIDSLKACFKSEGATAVALPSLKSLQGSWHTGDAKACKGEPGNTEGLMTFRNGELIAYESTCKIIGTKANGQFLALRMICYFEGMQSRSSEVYEILDDQKIRVTHRDRGKTYSVTSTRCPASR